MEQPLQPRRIDIGLSLGRLNDHYLLVGVTDDHRDGLDWFEEKWDDEDPFFMRLHYMDVHYPFHPPNGPSKSPHRPALEAPRRELNGKMQEEPDCLTEEDVDDLLKLYEGEIRFTDHYIGKLLDELENEGILDETFVVVRADQGEAFGEHGRFDHHPYLYDELLRVPLIVHAPGVESRTVEQQIFLLDLGPTLYDLLDIGIPDAVQGTSFVPLFHGEELEKKVAIVTEASGKTLACRTSEWKCLWLVEEGQVGIFDLQSEPDELHDVSEEHPDVVAEFQERMRTYLDEAEATDIDLPEVEMNDEVEQRLRDLGYR